MTIDLPAKLNSFDPAERRAALDEFANYTQVPLAEPLRVNMHCHTFFSYNGYDASPSMVAARAIADGWYAAGICDFDVLDGKDEFLAACDLLRLRGTANMETRVYFREYADHEINSPGEPGVYYFMGAGFVNDPAPGSAAATQLAKMRAGAQQRTRDLVDRVNAYLGDLQLDFEAHVLPLTPSGNATERHVCAAYYAQTGAQFGDREEAAAWWAGKLDIDVAAAGKLLADPMAFADLVRKKLMKRGGPGYVQPTPETFPPLDDVIAMIQACDAVPMATWLDGTSSGEAEMEEQLCLLLGKGVAALNIIPDRNWNIKDPDERDLKIRKFHECVEIADKLNLPVNIGTELNKFGQPWVDDFTAEPMRAVADSFIHGARVMVGHCRLLRFADFGYASAAAVNEYPQRNVRNAFFAGVGALPPPPPAVLDDLQESSPEPNFARLSDAAQRGGW